MTLSQLKTFGAVCRHMSFTGAAEELFLSQPAVSRQINALEQELGVQLFVRSRNTISFTDAGEHLSRELVPLVERMETVFRQARQIREGLMGHLHVGLLADQRIDPFLSEILRSLMQPVVQLSIRRMDFLRLENALHTGEIDVAVGLEQGEQAFAGCSRILLGEERMCLAIHRELLPRGLGEEIGDEWPELPCPVLLPELDSFPESQYSELRGIRSLPTGGIREYDFDSIAPIVASALGAAIVNEGNHLSVDRDVVFIPVTRARPVRKGLFWLEENQNPVLHRLLELVRQGQKGRD